MKINFMITKKNVFGPPLIVSIYLFLAILASALWLYSFIQQITDPAIIKNKAVETTKILLLIAYVTHLPVLVSLPYCSRPWLWNKENHSLCLRLLSTMLGYDDDGGVVGDHWVVGGARAVASFLIAWAPFLFATHGGSGAWNMAGILALAVEGFLAAEMVKHTEAEDGFFMCQMASATCAAKRVFGMGGRKLWTVLLVCLVLIFLRSVLPWYEDVFTLLPEPYKPPPLIEEEEEEEEEDGVSKEENNDVPTIRVSYY